MEGGAGAADLGVTIVDGGGGGAGGAGAPRSSPRGATGVSAVVEDGDGSGDAEISVISLSSDPRFPCVLLRLPRLSILLDCALDHTTTTNFVPLEVIPSGTLAGSVSLARVPFIALPAYTSPLCLGLACVGLHPPSSHGPDPNHPPATH
jgi:hypothetical protein